MIGIELFLLLVLQHLGAHNHLAHDLGHDGLCLVGSLLYLLVRDLYGVVEAAQVCDDADAEGADAAVVGHDDFGNGAHAYGVAAQDAIHLILGGSLEGGSLDAHIDTVLQAYLLFASYLAGQFDERGIIGFVHVGEAWSRGEVLAAQRMLWEEVDMVGDDHQVANLEAGVHAASRIADEEGLDAQLVHHAYGEGDLLHGVALVVVEAALHGHDIHSAELSEDELAAVALDRGHGEVGYVTIGYLLCVSYL